VNRTDLQLALVQELLAAPGNPEGWQRFLERACAALHGSAARFIAHRFEPNGRVAADVTVTVNTDSKAVEEYQQYWCAHDPWRNAMSPDVGPGAVLIGDALLTRRQMTRTAFYNDFGRRYDTTQCLAGILEMSPQRISNISFNRNDSARRFEADDAALLGALMPHLGRALEVHRRLCGAELMAAHAAAVFERIPFGLILISAAGRILLANRAAEETLRAADGLWVDRGELRAATASITGRLRALLHAAVRVNQGEAVDGGCTLALPRGSGRRPLSILVAPLPAQRIALSGDGAAAAVFVTDPDRMCALDPRAISGLFELTAADSELVRCLIAGLSIEQAAAHLGLRQQTLRTRLKTVFQKTNTNRQAELVRLVLMSAATLA
jgi:DNA-binding CsgD family transcriptional regulator/PAS domain-containing protein